MDEGPVLSDGVVVLRPMVPDDVVAHLLGEDDESIRWLNEGHASTIETTAAFVERNLAWWRDGGPRRMLAIRDAATDRLAGMIEANLDADGSGGPSSTATLSYQLHPWARGRHFATRAVALTSEYLATELGVDRLWIRIDPANVASIRVARAAGFVPAPELASAADRFVTYQRTATRPPVDAS